MPGGDAARRHYTGGGKAACRFHNRSRRLSLAPEVIPDRHFRPNFPSAQMILSSDAVILPNFKEEGFTVVSLHTLKPLWTAKLFHPPTIEITPVCRRTSLFFALSGAPAYFGRIDLESGDIQYVADAKQPVKSLSTPLLLERTDGHALVVWCFEKGFHILEVDEKDNRTDFSTLYCRGLGETETLVGTAADSQRLYAVTSQGRVVSLDWNYPIAVINLKGPVVRTVLERPLLAGFPLALDGGVWFLAADMNLHNALYAVRSKQGSTTVHALVGEGLTEHLPEPGFLYQIHLAYEGAVVFVPGYTTEGVHIMTDERNEFVPSRQRLSPRSAIGLGSCVLSSDTRAVSVIESIHKPYYEAIASLDLLVEGEAGIPLGCPVTGPEGLYVLTNQFLFHFE